ncbi:GNAT family N-acetyltransferase [Mucilaginibacter dorajii]|uniref:GNAT family N-acetyltransferase n=1 Tax=Mucilaginibacter dorajii TaxID=692994 RepID=A0ABP7P9W6_9SPHI|nr:GNAT family N-acetyltransferase [Mucilaginibacter dorajii]MCS3735198.1 ElaA protein [Mucilaginibacter dorajii]
MEFSTVVKPFDELTPAQLYAILRLRNEVFVVEQNCVFQDADNKDPHCNHLMLFNEGELMAYARIVPAGVAYEEMSIGRVVTSPKARGTGAGRILMTKAIELCYEILGAGQIRIGAQCYIKNFYASLGFVETGDPYDEDGILHIEMVK